MTPLEQGGLFLIQFASGLIIFTLMLRFLLRATYIDWRHPIVQFVAKITNPLCKPVSLIFKVKSRWDWGAIITAMLVQALTVVLIGLLAQKEFGVAVIAISAITEILNQLLDMLFWLIIIQIILSWVSQGYNPNTAIFEQLTRPILAPFQRLLPATGGFDFSPILAILSIKLAQIVVVGSIAQMGSALAS